VLSISRKSLEIQRKSARINRNAST